MKIIQERSKCIGCGSCEAVCPKFFKMAEDGLADLIGATKVDDNLELEVPKAGCISEAAEVCPAQIIKTEN